MKDNEKHITWGCSDDLESRFRKTLYCGEDENCFYSTPSASLTDVAVSMYLDAAPSPKRRLSPRYASSIAKKMPLSPCTIMMGILYAERLRKTNCSYLHQIASSDLFVVSMLIASKYLVDEGESDEIFNDEWAAAGGLAIRTINKLEIEVLCALNWQLYVSPDEFLMFCNSIETKIALQHGIQRGWFSYTDITHCLDTLQLHSAFLSVVENAVKVVVGCAVAYGISVALVAASAGVLRNASSTSRTTAVAASRGDFCTGSGLHSFGSRPFTRDRHRLLSSVADSTTLVNRTLGTDTSTPRPSNHLAHCVPTNPFCRSGQSNDTRSSFSPDTKSTALAPYSSLAYHFYASMYKAFNGTASSSLNLKLTPMVVEETFIPLFQTRFEPSNHITWLSAAHAY